MSVRYQEPQHQASTSLKLSLQPGLCATAEAATLTTYSFPAGRVLRRPHCHCYSEVDGEQCHWHRN
eukprot:2635036-Pleurochrysis_carterae.AAC.1